MKNKQQPGYESHTSLDVRMKLYEATTDYSLIPKIPVYIRLDGRAFHSFCRGLEKPFDTEFFSTMKKVTAYLHEKNNAMLSFCQSDEISLVFESPEKMPFGTRLFKIQSVFAGMCSAAFCMFGLQSSSQKLKDKILKMIPHFDCRCCQMPIEECANMIVWRSQDSTKNSITQLALAHFSDRQIHHKNSDEKITMLKNIGVDYIKDIPEDLRIGAFFRREVYEKTLTDEELMKIPEKSRKLDADGKMRVVRSHITQFKIGMRLASLENKVGALFRNEPPVQKCDII